MVRYIIVVIVICFIYVKYLPCMGQIETIKIDHHHNENKNHLRSKRHLSGNNQHDRIHLDSSKITKNFVAKFFNEYGQDGTIDVNGFNRLLKSLNLYKLIENKTATRDRSISSTDTIDGSSSSYKQNSTCITMEELLYSINPKKKVEYQKPSCSLNHVTINSVSDGDNKPCDHHALEHNWNTKDFFNLCPILLYHLTMPSKLGHFGCINQSILMDVNIGEITNLLRKKNTYILVWIYAFFAVLACSLLGIIGVAIIPCVNTWFFKDVLQFLVSVAVGTMTGDALLHLLPHAIAGNNETQMIYKGLICMGGIIFFYATEHTLTFFNERRNKSGSKADKQPKSSQVICETELKLNQLNNDKISQTKYNSYPYNYEKIPKEGVIPTLNQENALNQCNESVNDLLMNDNQIPKDDSNGNNVRIMSTNVDENLPTLIHDDCTSNNEDRFVVILKEHALLHHGHGHGHGHGHSHKHNHNYNPPKTLSAIVWMILLGDGLHNFTDGMAIGAAFSENLAGGFSTSLAVFCHELPHELGDFAILIQAGMTVKSAIYYNLLTGILSFIGMAFGIIFGQSKESTQWMFAAAAGLFIYIALVDMMPQMSAVRTSIMRCFLQVIGMLLGLILMLIIALYEESLLNTFIFYDSDSGSSHKRSHN